jgi:hypothetical protein
MMRIVTMDKLPSLRIFRIGLANVLFAARPLPRRRNLSNLQWYSPRADSLSRALEGCRSG